MEENKESKIALEEGEFDFRELNEKDRFQCLTRYLNNLCAYNNSLLQIVADQYVIIEMMAKKMGIDVRAEKNEIAKKMKEQIDLEAEKAKQALIDSAKGEQA